ncbi:hypothetical protein [Pseudomonas sp. P42]|uniref:hypothetical protein n=1 Tax=Pseudomonas sp. P42 TaxID=1080160 RepID=UPI001B32CA59|nr:hypothetical protein [Pseudomonas sp. P42]MBP5949666.1 hypothetical protein [Pseudomonas sp. P42]
MKVVATNGYKKATTTCTPNPVGAAEGCNLLTRMFLNPKQDQKITACGSAYTKRYKNDHKKNAPNQSGRFHEDAASGLQRFNEHLPDAERPG